MVKEVKIGEKKYELYQNIPQIIDSDRIMDAINFLKEVFERLKEKFIDTRENRKIQHLSYWKKCIC